MNFKNSTRKKSTKKKKKEKTKKIPTKKNIDENKEKYKSVWV